MIKLHKILCFFTFLFSLVVFGQDNFSAGYYIDQDNKKNEGYIEDINPYNNPSKIYFKNTLNEKSIEILLENIKEYKVEGNYKYVRHNVEYDYGRVANKNEFNVFGKQPDLRNKVLLLKVLVEGNMSLYKAVIDDVIFYYITNSNFEIPQLLIYRKYNGQDSRIYENNDFRKQLYNSIKSENKVLSDFTQLEYEEKSLVNFFSRINNLDNSLIDQKINSRKYKNSFHYKIFVGISPFITNYKYLGQYELDDSTLSFINPIIGLEVSTNYGTYSRRTEFFARLFYQKVQAKSFTSTEIGNIPGSKISFKSDFSSINISAGGRYAIFKKGNSKITLDAAFGVSEILNGDFNINVDASALPPDNFFYTVFKRNIFFNLGVGYTFNSKHSLNFEYSTSREYLKSYEDLKGNFSNFNLIFIYCLN